MPPEHAGAAVTVRYWAGARAAAGVDSDTVTGCRTVADVVAAVTRLRPALAPVTAVSSLLLEGRPASPDVAVVAGSVLEVLPTLRWWVMGGCRLCPTSLTARRPPRPRP